MFRNILNKKPVLNIWERLILTVGLFLEVFLKFQNTFKNTNEEMLLILPILRFGREANISSSIKKFTAFRKKRETHMLY